MQLLIIIILFLNLTNQAMSDENKYEKAILAGGCFWCIESDFDKLEGVISTISGYTGGTEKNPTYKEVSAGHTSHYEAVEIIYDTNIISYQQILEKFFRSIDPLDAGGQFCDRGNQYRSAIFYLNQKQHDIAIIERNKVAKLLGAEIATNITEVLTFYPAEDYHQNYHLRGVLKSLK